MTLITKGMGAVLKAVKKGSKSVKQGFVNPTTNKPLYAVGAVVLGGKIAYEKVKTKLKKKKKDK
jgi:hypothetical protein